MNKNIWVFAGMVFLGACTTLPQENVGTKGLPLCTDNELCPLMTVSWNDQRKDNFQVKVSLDSIYQYYDIQKVTFSNDEKSYSFNPETKTTQELILNLRHSKNSIVVPKNLMADLKSDRISINIHTDQGVISRFVYKDGVESSIYKQFTSVYNP